MAQPEAQRSTPSHHHAINVVEAAADGTCAVCMEPAAWVAVGACGHGEVCAACAARIRFFQKDRRCCICRSHCPTVVVTRAKSRAAAQAHQAAFLWPAPPLLPPALGREGRLVRFYWYHAGMGAYFDDERQYEAVKRFCVDPSCAPTTTELAVSQAVNAHLLLPPPQMSVSINIPPQQWAASLNDVSAAGGAPLERAADAPLRPPPTCPCVPLVTLYLAFMIWITGMFAVSFVHVAENLYEKVIMAVVFGLASAAVTACAICAWCNSNNLQDRDG